LPAIFSSDLENQLTNPFLRKEWIKALEELRVGDKVIAGVDNISIDSKQAFIAAHHIELNQTISRDPSRITRKYPQVRAPVSHLLPSGKPISFQPKASKKKPAVIVPSDVIEVSESESELDTKHEDESDKYTTQYWERIIMEAKNVKDIQSEMNKYEHALTRMAKTKGIKDIPTFIQQQKQHLLFEPKGFSVVFHLGSIERLLGLRHNSGSRQSWLDDAGVNVIALTARSKGVICIDSLLQSLILSGEQKNWEKVIRSLDRQVLATEHLKGIWWPFLEDENHWTAFVVDIQKDVGQKDVGPSATLWRFDSLLESHDSTKERQFLDYFLKKRGITLEEEKQVIFKEGHGQKDSHSCGVYVAHLFQSLSQSKNWDVILNEYTFGASSSASRLAVLQFFIQQKNYLK
jgi:hypothetical protein